MMSIKYIWSKLIKKLRLSSIINSNIHKTSTIESGSNVVNVIMDKYSYCGYDCEIVNAKIGAYCSIAYNVTIGGAMHPMEWASTSPVFYYGRDSVKKKFASFHRAEHKKTIIGNDVWIGGGSFIKQGVRISDGAVVGMGSIVTKDVPPYAIVAGNPAKLIRYRFDDETINKLLKSEWWTLEDEDLTVFARNIREPMLFADSIITSRL